MAQNTRISCPAGVWTQLTDADVAADISVMLASNVGVSLQATSNATAPTDNIGPLELLSKGDGWSEATILEKFPGVALADRLWAKPNGSTFMNSADAVVAVSHDA